MELDKNTDFIAYIKKLKQQILKNNHHTPIQEFHLTIHEMFDTFPQAKNLKNHHIFHDFPAQKIFINNTLIKK